MEKEQLFIIHKVEDIINPVMDLISNIHEELKQKGVIIFLNGDLATGKTMFVREFANAVGINENIKSPTFVLMKSYDVSSVLVPELKKIVHVDAYRLEPHHKNALQIDDFQEEAGTIVFVEWPMAIDLDIDLAFAIINFTVITEEMRKIDIIYKKLPNF